MSARIYWSEPGVGTVEITSRIQIEDWTVQEQAEEGQAGQSTIAIADPAMNLTLAGYRLFFVVEDASESTDNVLFGGYLANFRVSRGESETLEPLGRVWHADVVDMNSVWNRRVMLGSDCKRPSETDVARVQWLFSTAETGIFDDETTYVSSASPVSMDKVDYRGQYRDQVISDCSQASGKNWWAQYHETGTGREIFVWYGADSLAAYDSPLYLSNDPTDWTDSALADGTSLVWPLGDDTEGGIDNSRIYSGVVVQWAKGWVYRVNTTTRSTYATRDFIAPSANVKTKTKAIARANRYLASLNEPDTIITTTVEVPAAKATKLRAGMRVPVKATHIPGVTAWQWCRVRTCQITPVAAGTRYKLRLELSPTGVTAGAAPATEPTAGAVLYQPVDGSGSEVTGIFPLVFESSGDLPGAGYAYQPRDAASFNYTGSAGANTGLVVLANAGRLDLHLNFSFIDVGSAKTFTGQLLLNGSVVLAEASHTTTTEHTHTFDLSASGVRVAAGDTITGRMISDTLANPSIPAGVGSGTHKLEILNTSLVSA